MLAGAPELATAGGRPLSGSPLREVRRRHEQRRRQLPRALLLGLVAGIVAVAFRAALGEAERFRAHLVELALATGGVALVLPVAFAATGTALALVAVVRLAPETSGSGIPHVKAVLHGVRAFRWFRVLLVKFAAGVTGIAAGLALGREGPTIQMGAAVGEALSRFFPSTARERRTLVSAGAGAGLAAAFNAPLSGLVFVLEEVQRDFAPGVFAITLVASVVADVVTRMLLGQLPVFHVEVAAAPPLATLPLALLIGGVAGILGVGFNRCLLASLRVFEAARTHHPARLGGIVGAAVGCVALAAPDVVGGGHGLLERAFAGEIALAGLVILFLVRFVLTMASYGCGAAGGIFAPLLILGALLGLAIGDLAAAVMPELVPAPGTLAVVGMAAFFTAIVRAPLTGIVLMVEMTGQYSLVLPFLVASLAAYGLADLLGDLPVYEALLERDLARDRGTPTPLEETLLLDLTIAPGAPFDGMTVRDLRLPTGCILIALHRGASEEVPTAVTQLQAGDRVTALVAPKASEAIPLLREGAGLAPRRESASPQGIGRQPEG